MQIADITCPISNQIFKNPVIAADGYIYEKTCIEKWLEIKKTSPMTNNTLDNTELHDVFFLKNIIVDMIKQNPELKNQQYNSDPDINTDTEKVFNNIVKNRNYEKLLDFKKIDLCLLMNIAETQLHSFYSNSLQNFLRNETVMKHIIDNCIDLNIPIKSSWRLIHYICWADTPEDLIRYIIDKGADLEVATADLDTPIHFLLRNNTPKLAPIKYMIDKGVNLTTSNSIGMIPIEMIYMSADFDLIKYVDSKNIDYSNSKLINLLMKNYYFKEKLDKKKITDIIKLIE